MTFSAAELDFTLGDAEFTRISQLVQRHFGIQLPPQKRGLVQQRLRRLLPELGCKSFEEFCVKHIGDAPSQAILGRLVDRISTNHTFFWREPAHFEHLRDEVLPQLHTSKSRDRDIRLWCAAAATGEEPWTLAMLLTEAFRGDGWSAGLLATDISAPALETAARGVYRQENVARLPKAMRKRWMVPASDGTVSIHASLRPELTLRRLNLLEGRFPSKRPFDVVFCRNVMIYFDDATRRSVVARIAAVTAPGAYLYIGHSETLGRGDPFWRFERPGIYRRMA
jgi:chemotaxis protein methyltransferase CheR